MQVRCCPECGAEQIDVVTMGDLEAHYAPPLVYFKGEQLMMSNSEARMVYTLIRRGRASHDALAILPNGEYAGQPSVRSRLTSIRKKFDAAGVPYDINNIIGYGYAIKEIK